MNKRNALILALLSTVACYGECDGGRLGTGPTPPPAPPPPVIIVASPTPAPSPSASATPNPLVCGLQPSVSVGCESASLPALEARVAGIQSTFSPIGMTEAAYVSALVQRLKAAGICARNGAPLSSDKIEVKISNDWSEEYDVFLATGQPWLKYERTCRPANF